MSKTYRPYQPTQSFLLPPSPLDWLPEDHLAGFVLGTVGKLDLRFTRLLSDRALIRRILGEPIGAAVRPAVGLRVFVELGGISVSAGTDWRIASGVLGP